MNEPYTVTGPDSANPATHNLIVVRGVTYSVFTGQEQNMANDIAASFL